MGKRRVWSLAAGAEPVVGQHPASGFVGVARQVSLQRRVAFLVGEVGGQAGGNEFPGERFVVLVPGAEGEAMQRAVARLVGGRGVGACAEHHERDLSGVNGGMVQGKHAVRVARVKFGKLVLDEPAGGVDVVGFDGDAYAAPLFRAFHEPDDVGGLEFVPAAAVGGLDEIEGLENLLFVQGGVGDENAEGSGGQCRRVLKTRPSGLAQVFAEQGCAGREWFEGFHGVRVFLRMDVF